MGVEMVWGKSEWEALLFRLVKDVRGSILKSSQIQQTSLGFRGAGILLGKY